MADIGDTLAFRAELRDKPAEQGGVLTNALSAALTVALPDGTTTAPTVPAPATTGHYAVDYTPAQSGRHVGSWLFTMAGGKTTSYVETFDVGASLVTVDEAIAHLRAQGVVTSSADLEQLQWLCFVATDAVERDLGRVIVRRTVTETYNGGADYISLDSTPVVSITTVVDSGVTLSALDWVLDRSILRRGTTSYSSRFTRGRMNVVVTYVAGYSNPPPVCRQAALTLIQSLWQTSQQSFHPGLDESSFESFAAPALAGLSQIPGYDSMRAVGIA
jgi:hypothetical protein